VRNYFYSAAWALFMLEGVAVSAELAHFEMSIATTRLLIVKINQGKSSVLNHESSSCNASGLELMSSNKPVWSHIESSSIEFDSSKSKMCTYFGTEKIDVKDMGRQQPATYTTSALLMCPQSIYRNQIT
jgi:hypothetical protein